MNQKKEGQLEVALWPNGDWSLHGSDDEDREFEKYARNKSDDYEIVFIDDNNGEGYFEDEVFAFYLNINKADAKTRVALFS